MSARSLGLPLLRRQATPKPVRWPLRGPSGIFTKGLRDSRRACLLAGIGLGLFAFMYGSSMATNYPTPAARQQAVDSLMAVQAIGAMGGAPLNAATLGGFLSWRVTSLFPLIIGVWSAIALSGALAGEIRAGSFELLGTVPLSRRRIALEKIASHLTSLAIAGLITGLSLWLTGIAWARLPGDGIALPNALAQSLGEVLLGLVSGAIAFAVGPFIGRSAAAGLGVTALFAAFLLDSYRSAVSALQPVSGLSWFAWFANERPMANSWDVAGAGLVAGFVLILLIVGVVAFERRDAGAVVRVPGFTLPGRRFLLGGPGREAFLETRPAALAWGVALALFGLIAAVSSPGYITQFSDPESAKLMDRFFPGVEWRTVPAMLQFMFFALVSPFMALAGASLVHGLASSEPERRLDLLLSVPVSRPRWLVVSGFGLYVSLTAMTLVVAIGVALGVVSTGTDAVRPFAGVCVAGLYAAALAGVGLAIFGLGRPGLAGAATAALAVGFVVLDLLGGAMRLPSDVLALSLTRHLGQPMTGVYDWPGLLLMTAISVGGLLVGAWGLRRRDLST